MPAMLSREPFGLRGFGDGCRLFAVTKHDAVLALQFRESCIVADVVAFSVRDRNPQNSSVFLAH